MAYAKQWNKLSEVPPPLDKQIYFLWTDPLMYGHIEAGVAFRRKLDGSIHYNYFFIGALEPTHWFINETEFPPLPESEPKRKSFREFFAERTDLEPGKWAWAELNETSPGRLMETVADYMDYISGSEPEKAKEPETCLQCKHFVDAKDTGFHAMGCRRGDKIYPITGEFDMSKSNCFEAKQ